ncbi:hypothetical protein RIF29_25137 [Crotalaria pallida]|uniref:Uncharacterized protein n=1 Tax=Crotalaria pallida TaxID=3830 RepID=A0AAN9ELT7_CROPI
MDSTTVTPTPPPLPAAKVQHLTKKSSKELLNKFADESLEKKKLDLRVVIKRQQKKRGGIIRREDQYDSPSNGGGAAVVERRSLLPAAMTRRSVLLRQLRARDVRNNKSLLGTIQKTWRRTVEGASRVFMEKHYHRHKRLINDIV